LDFIITLFDKVCILIAVQVERFNFYIIFIQVGSHQELLANEGAFAEFLRNYSLTEETEKEGDPTGKYLFTIRGQSNW